MTGLLSRLALPSLEELRVQPCAAQKGQLKVVERAVKVRAAKLTEREAKAAIWVRAKFRCERCGKSVQKGADSLTAGHVHHLKKRSQGGTWALGNLLLLCTICHGKEHS